MSPVGQWYYCMGHSIPVGRQHPRWASETKRGKTRRSGLRQPEPGASILVSSARTPQAWAQGMQVQHKPGSSWWTNKTRNGRQSKILGPREQRNPRKDGTFDNIGNHRQDRLKTGYFKTIPRPGKVVQPPNPVLFPGKQQNMYSFWNIMKPGNLSNTKAW